MVKSHNAAQYLLSAIKPQQLEVCNYLTDRWFLSKNLINDIIGVTNMHVVYGIKQVIKRNKYTACI